LQDLFDCIIYFDIFSAALATYFHFFGNSAGGEILFLFSNQELVSGIPAGGLLPRPSKAHRGEPMARCDLAPGTKGPKRWKRHGQGVSA
jgi:hypothetical protein